MDIIQEFKDKMGRALEVSEHMLDEHVLERDGEYINVGEEFTLAWKIKNTNDFAVKITKLKIIVFSPASLLLPMYYPIGDITAGDFVGPGSSDGKHEISSERREGKSGGSPTTATRREILPEDEDTNIRVIQSGESAESRAFRFKAVGLAFPGSRYVVGDKSFFAYVNIDVKPDEVESEFLTTTDENLKRIDIRRSDDYRPI